MRLWIETKTTPLSCETWLIKKGKAVVDLLCFTVTHVPRNSCKVLSCSSWIAIFSCFSRLADRFFLSLTHISSLSVQIWRRPTSQRLSALSFGLTYTWVKRKYHSHTHTQIQRQRPLWKDERSRCSAVACRDFCKKENRSPSSCVYIPHLQLLSAFLPQLAEVCPGGSVHSGGVRAAVCCFAHGVNVSGAPACVASRLSVASVKCDAISLWWWKVDFVQVSIAECESMRKGEGLVRVSYWP